MTHRHKVIDPSSAEETILYGVWTTSSWSFSVQVQVKHEIKRDKDKRTWDIF